MVLLSKQTLLPHENFRFCKQCNEPIDFKIKLSEIGLCENCYYNKKTKNYVYCNYCGNLIYYTDQYDEYY